MKIFEKLLMVFLGVLISTPLVAQTVWVGGTDSEWSTAANWSPATVPWGSAASALLGDASTADRTITLSSTGSLTGDVLKTLTMTESSGFNNILSVTRSKVNITDQVTLGSSNGTVQMDLYGSSLSNTIASFSGGITLNTGGVLTVQKASDGAHTGIISGIVTLTGGTLGIGTKSVNSGYLYMEQIVATSGTVDFGKVNASQTLDISSANLSGVTIAGTGSGLIVVEGGNLSLSNLTKGTGFKTLSVQLYNGAQSFSGVGELLKFGTGSINFRGSGVKTLSDASGSVGTISFDTRTSSPATLKLGSNLAVASGSVAPYATTYSGQLTTQALIDLNGYTLDVSAVTTGSGKWTPTSSANWALSSSQAGGRFKALSYNFSTTTVSVGANVTLEASGGNGAVNDLGTTGGAMDSTSKFAYTGAATAANAALLNTGVRTLGNLDVKNGALKASTSSVTVAGQTVVDANGKLDLSEQNLTTDKLSVKGGASITGAHAILVNSLVAGDGAIAGPTTSNGHFSPGATASNDGVGVGGTLAFGSDLAFGANSILDLELGSIADYVTVGGNLSFGSNTLLNLSKLDGTLYVGEQFALFTLTGTGTISGFSNLIKGTYAGGLDGDLSLAGGYVLFTVTAVPEPSAVVLIISGVVTLLVGTTMRKNRSV